MRNKKALLLIGIACLLTLSISAQELVFTKASSKIFSEEQLKGLIHQYAFSAVRGQKIPQQVFDGEYKKIEKQLWTVSRPRIVKAFRWVESAGSVLTQEKRNGMYKQELNKAVRDVVLNNDVFKSLRAVDQTDRILSFVNDVKINRDGWLTVSEYITIYNGSGEQSNSYMELYPDAGRTVNNDIQRGLERTFPTDYTNHLGLRTEVPFEVISVEKNGQSENFIVVEYGNGFLVRIGSADIRLEDGVYTYVITYKTKYQLIFKEDKTELYWNVNGNGWVFTADSVSSRITFPSGSVIFEDACYTGVQGSTERNCSSKIINDSTIWFFTNKRLESYEGLTIAAAIKPGIIAAPALTETTVNLLIGNWPLVLIASVVLLIFLINLFNWFRIGRDPKQGVIIPTFEPPNDISPADAGYVYNQKYKTEQFSAALIDLAVKRGINIQVAKEGLLFKKNTYTFLKANGPASVKSFARSAYDWNLDNLYNLKADGSYNSTFESLNASLRAKLDNKFHLNGAKNKSFSRNAGAASWGFVVLFITGIVAAITISNIATPMLIVSAIVLLLFGLISQIIFSKIMPAYSKQGRKLMDELQGFRMYLATAEERRFDKLNPPEKNLELFERLLPYAVALDCQHEWANKFEDLLKVAIANKTYQPTYYSGDMNDNLSFSTISQSFSSSLSSTIASSSTAPSSSSDGGSSGGGSSGGGGGGGGGGGW